MLAHFKPFSLRGLRVSLLTVMLLAAGACSTSTIVTSASLGVPEDEFSELDGTADATKASDSVNDETDSDTGDSGEPGADSAQGDSTDSAAADATVSSSQRGTRLPAIGEGQASVEATSSETGDESDTPSSDTETTGGETDGATSDKSPERIVIDLSGDGADQTPEATESDAAEPDGATDTDGEGGDGDATDTDGEDSQEPAESDAGTQAGQNVDGAVAFDGIVTVLDAGSEPRTLMRLAPEPQCQVLARFEQAQNLTQTMAGTQLPSPGSLGQVYEMLYRSEPNGSGFSLETEFVAGGPLAGVAPEIAAEIRASLDPIVGSKTRETLTTRGEVVPGSLQLTGGAGGPALLEAISQTSEAIRIVLPAEPVGLGANWLVESSTEFQGMGLNVLTSATITDISGSVITIETTQTQSVPPGSSIELVAGITADVVDWDASGTNRIVLDLNSIVPISVDGSSTADQTLDAGADFGVLQQSITVGLKMTSRPGDGCSP